MNKGMCRDTTPPFVPGAHLVLHSCSMVESLGIRLEKKVTDYTQVEFKGNTARYALIGMVQLFGRHLEN